MKNLMACTALLGLLTVSLAALSEPGPFDRGNAFPRPEFSLAQGAESQTLLDFPQKRPWMAGVLTLTANMVVWSFDRFVKNEEWSRINWRTIRENLRSGFHWDSNHFVTNFFSHPYHGSAYFNSARSNGLSFWESVPYVIGGSLLWEIIHENESPSINDLFITTTAGIMLGESLHRVTALVLDERSRGIERVVREIIGAVLNPAAGVNRLLGGAETYQHSLNALGENSVNGSIALGGRGIIKGQSHQEFEVNGALELSMTYGEPFRDNSPIKPFDYFEANAWISPGEKGSQFSLSEFALLFSKNIYTGQGHKHLIGIFQHYDFFNSKVMELGSSAVGGGLLSRFQVANDLHLDASAHLGAIMLGASRSEYVLEDERDYNYGWGYTTKFNGTLSHQRFGNLTLNFSQFWIHTLLGAAGAERLYVATARLNVPIFRKTGLGVEYFFFNRQGHYHNFADITKEINGFRFLIISEF